VSITKPTSPTSPNIPNCTSSRILASEAWARNELGKQADTWSKNAVMLLD
jgi:hypothetical protein